MPPADHQQDHDLADRRASGGTMVTLGIVLMVGSFVGAVVMSMPKHGQRAELGAEFSAAQSPLFMLAFFGGLLVLVLGAVKRSAARREADERARQDHMIKIIVPVEDAPGGPLRGAAVDTLVLDPVVAEQEAIDRAKRLGRGSVYLSIGGIIITLSVIGLVMALTGDSHGSPRERIEGMMLALGAAFFPFGLGLFLAIKGLLLRSS